MENTLDKSWSDKYGLQSNAIPKLMGASLFQQKAIEELEKQIKENSSTGDYNQGIIRGLRRAITNIKNLKA